jgi:3-phosphoshikimate 1-carboxyvinyltransferase
MVMAAAVLGLRVPGLIVEDVTTVGKTMPEFTTLWADMLEGHTPSAAPGPTNPGPAA